MGGLKFMASAIGGIILSYSLISWNGGNDLNDVYNVVQQLVYKIEYLELNSPSSSDDWWNNVEPANPWEVHYIGQIIENYLSEQHGDAGLKVVAINFGDYVVLRFYGSDFTSNTIGGRLNHILNQLFPNSGTRIIEEYHSNTFIVRVVF